MNRQLVLGVLSGLTAIALALGGTTYSALNDFGQVDGNVVGAGFLELSLGPNGAEAPLQFGQVMPGETATRVIWAASLDGASVPDANLYLTFHHLADHAGTCSTSRGKALGEIESGIAGCTVVGDAVGGTPAQGNLSRVLTFQVGYYPGITDEASCAGAQEPKLRTSILAATPGNLHASAMADGGSGARYELMAGTGTPLVLAGGSGVCVVIDAGWPQNSVTWQPSPDHPSDNAAQGDSLTVDMRFDLNQVA